MFCLVENHNQVVYDRMFNEVQRMIILGSPEGILLGFESAAINAFRSALPNATVAGCYFHFTQSVMRKVNEIGMNEGYERMTI